MPKIRYSYINPGKSKLDIIAKTNSIIEEFVSQGFKLTVRMIYYKFIARDLLPDSWIDEEYNEKHGLDPRTKNTIKNYKRLAAIINEGRLGGFIDWEHIIDTTRFVRSLSTWESPQEIIDSCVRSFLTDKWLDQDHRIEVWVEKDAMGGVISPVCKRLEVPWVSCRGYTSQSEMWGAAQRLLGYIKEGKTAVVLHLGDHDPSGKNMSEDIAERLQLFIGPRNSVEFIRIALNMDQVEEYELPPNPAKVTDSRYNKYEKEHGEDSWELDALDPTVIDALISKHVLHYRDEKEWKANVAVQETMRLELSNVRDLWPAVVKFVDREIAKEKKRAKKKKRK